MSNTKPALTQPATDPSWAVVFKVIAYAMKAVIILIIPGSIIFRSYDFLLAAGCLIAILIISIPEALSRRYRVRFPWYLDFAITTQLFIHLGGVYFGWYNAVPLYDRYAHFLGGFLIAMIFFVFAYSLNYILYTRLNAKLLIALTIIVSLALGAFWEILEFAGDIFLKLGAQGQNIDTMGDLVLDFAGGIFTAGLLSFVVSKIPGDVTRKHFFPYYMVLSRLFNMNPDELRSLHERLREEERAASVRKKVQPVRVQPTGFTDIRKV